MEKGESQSNQVYEEDPLVQGMRRIDTTQQAFFERTEAWKARPTKRRLTTLNQSVVVAQDVLESTLGTVLGPEDSPLSNEKLLSGATIVNDIDEKRTTAFRQMFPELNFEQSAITPEGLVKRLREDVEDAEDVELDTQDAIDYLINQYNYDLATDTDKFSSAVLISRQAKLINSRSLLTEHAIDIGKTTASLALAGIIAGVALKHRNK